MPAPGTVTVFTMRWRHCCYPWRVASSKLETLKTVVEIVAIVVAGIWAAFEFGYKEFEARSAGAHLRRANVQLASTATELKDGRHWILSRLTITNPSKRVVSTFLISWWYTYPPRKDGATRRTAITNVTKVYNLAPGESSEVSHLKLVRADEESAVVHAEVIFKKTEDDLDCIIVPGQQLPAGGVTAFTDQPRVCAAKSGKAECVKRLCSVQSSDALVHLQHAKSSVAQLP